MSVGESSNGSNNIVPINMVIGDETMQPLPVAAQENPKEYRSSRILRNIANIQCEIAEQFEAIGTEVLEKLYSTKIDFQTAIQEHIDNPQLRNPDTLQKMLERAVAFAIMENQPEEAVTHEEIEGTLRSMFYNTIVSGGTWLDKYIDMNHLRKKSSSESKVT